VEIPDVKTLGVTIRYPEPGAVVDALNVEGTFTSLPPAGFELRSLRYYPLQHGFIPHGTIAVDRMRYIQETIDTAPHEHMAMADDIHGEGWRTPFVTLYKARPPMADIGEAKKKDQIR